MSGLPAGSPLEAIRRQTAGGLLLGVGYLLCVGGGVGGLLVALWIAVRRPRSRHHAALMVIIVVLVVVAGIYYYSLPKADAA